MAEASISVDQDQFCCPVCLDLLKDPVTVSCGHSYCMLCINKHWDKNNQKGVYTCPQCRETFTPRPVLRRNNMLAEVVEKVKKMELQAASPAPCYTGDGDVECDFCTGRKLKASKSCLVCVASLCETHLKPHLEIPALIKHKLVEASTRLQEKICSQHDRLMEIYCRTDQSFICYLCMMEQHKGHDTVDTAAERTKKKKLLKYKMRKSQLRLQKKKKKLEELKQSVKDLKSSAQAAVEDSEMIFAELISSIEKKRSEVTEQIRDQEKVQLSQTEELLEQLEKEITDLKRKQAEMEQLSHIEDPLQFLQSLESLSLGCANTPTPITVHEHLSFDSVRKSLSDLKEHLEEFCKEELGKIGLSNLQLDPNGEGERCSHSKSAIGILPILLSKPTTRDDFLQYFCHLTMDPNTVHHKLVLSEENKVVKRRGGDQRYPDHPERFDRWPQVLCKESLSGRCYWEVEWDNGGWGVSMSVSYKEISRKGDSDECALGGNTQSWSLLCSSVLSFWHNNLETKISGPSSSRIGVYVDHSAGNLSFYSVSDTMTLLHKVHTTFTHPLYAGFWMKQGTVKLCDPNNTSD